MNGTDPAVIEFANDAFYLAFNSGELREMEALWAVDHTTVCVHPGWRPLFDRDEIMQSWESIFAGQLENRLIICHEPRVLMQPNFYTVICYEQLASGWLVATNNFVLEQGAVKLVHHQAGQCLDPPEITQPGQTLQ